MFILYVLEEHRLKGKLKRNGLVMVFLKRIHIQSPAHCITFRLWVVHGSGLPHACALCATAIMSASDVALLKGLLTLEFPPKLLTLILRVSMAIVFLISHRQCHERCYNDPMAHSNSKVPSISELLKCEYMCFLQSMDCAETHWLWKGLAPSSHCPEVIVELWDMGCFSLFSVVSP